MLDHHGYKTVIFMLLLFLENSIYVRIERAPCQIYTWKFVEIDDLRIRLAGLRSVGVVQIQVVWQPVENYFRYLHHTLPILQQ